MGNEYFLFLPGCLTEGAYIDGGRNTPGGRALPSSGRADCARKCREDSQCQAWTMRMDNNLCWLKTTSEGTTSSEAWVWGLPCYGDCLTTDGAYINSRRNTAGHTIFLQGT